MKGKDACVLAVVKQIGGVDIWIKIPLRTIRDADEGC